MTAIVCVDEAWGMAFHGRRQSRDRAVCARILEDAAGRRLWMSRDTLRLFEAPYPEYLTAAEDFLAQAGPGELCFVEEPPLLPWLDRLEGLVLYRWNRRYPAYGARPRHCPGPAVFVYSRTGGQTVP